MAGVLIMDDYDLPMALDKLPPLLILSRLPGLGPALIYKGWQQYGSGTALLAASDEQWQALTYPASALETRQQLFAQNSPITRQLDRDLQWLQLPHQTVISLDDETYPQRLREITPPPPILLVAGDERLINAPQVAIVGSRHASAQGLENAYQFAGALAERGVVVTSGMALGIDGQAHEGCLQAGGSTVAVLGCGVDVCYPRRHRQLADEIALQGALVSELPLATGPQRSHFPRRNRIISGLSLGVLVVEAARESGSLITAKFALEQGREVFAIPGSIHNPRARGCHELIRQGAKLVERVEHILEELPPIAIEPALSGAIRAEIPALPAELYLLISNLTSEPRSINQLVDTTGRDPSRLSQQMVMLQIDGLVKEQEGGYSLTNIGFQHLQPS